MNPKEIIFNEEARATLLAGITKLANLVACTIGPKGRNVGLEKSWGAPSITNDGASIIRDVSVKNKQENLGISMAKEMVQKIKETCGDGSTTATLLLHALIESGVKNIAAGASPIGIKRGIDKAVNILIQELDKEAIAVKTHAEKQSIATVSASGNSDIGNMVAEALDKVNNSGAVTIEEAKGTETLIEVVKGMRFDKGYISPYFCSNLEAMTLEMSNPKILLVEKKITTIHDILPILQSVASIGAELLIIAEDIESEVLSTLVVNKLRGSLKIAAVKAPGFGDNRKALLEDIAALTGSTLVSEEAGINIKEADASILGSASKIYVNKDNTTIVDGAGFKEKINARVSQIEHELTTNKSSYEKEKLQERLAKLQGGVAVIKVGAATEAEMKQKKQMFEDSLSSTKAALEDGIVAGGGVALLHASKALMNLDLTADEKVGALTLIKACEAPLKQIAANAGLDGSVILNQVKNSPQNFGFNANTEKVENLFEAGIIDPAKVVKSIIVHAGSTAGIILLSEAAITDAEETEQ